MEANAEEPLLGRGDEEETGRRKSSSASRKGLRHATSDPSARVDGSHPQSLAKRRLDWRNSHHNYRSAPTTAGSREAQLISYEARRALRDPNLYSSHQNQQPSGASYRPTHLPKRCESMREAGDNADSPMIIPLQQQFRCRQSIPHQSPLNKRWRCQTIDCPCGGGSTQPIASQSKALLDEILAPHRHSFPCSDVGAKTIRQRRDGQPLRFE